MPKRTKTKPPQATGAEIAAYCNATPEAIEELAEMLPEERAQYVYAKLHPSIPLSSEEMRKAMQSPACPYRARGLECRSAGVDGACRCSASPLLPAPRLDELRDVLGMLGQVDADLTALRPEAAQQTLRDAIGVLRGELGPNATPARSPAFEFRPGPPKQGAVCTLRYLQGLLKGGAKVAATKTVGNGVRLVYLVDGQVNYYLPDGPALARLLRKYA